MFAANASVLHLRPSRLGRPSMGQWLKEHAIGVVVTIPLAAILAQGFSLSADVSRVDTTVKDQKDRLDRIAAEMPAMGIRIANEILRTPIQSAILVSPEKEIDGGVFRIVRLVNAADGRVRTYKSKVTIANDITTAMQLRGGVLGLDQKAVSLEDLVKYSIETQTPKAIPAAFDTSLGWVSKRDPTKLEALVRDLGYQEIGFSQIEPVPDSAQLLDALKSIEAQGANFPQ